MDRKNSSNATSSAPRSDRWDSSKQREGPLGSHVRGKSRSPDITNDPIALALAKKKPSSSKDVLSSSGHGGLGGSGHGQFDAKGAWVDPLSLSDHGSHRRTGDWMGTSSHSVAKEDPLDWSSHSDSGNSRILAKRYADANELNCKSRFTTQTSLSFRPKKTTPSGRKL